MKITKRLHDLGQSLWLDNITREMLDNGTLRRYIDDLSVTGLTSNPTIFDEAIGNTSAYDNGIRQKAQSGLAGEELFIELALEDLRRAADLFRPVFDRTQGIDGWVSMEVSPLLANDTKTTIDAALRIHKQANRPNLYVKIPGTPAGVPAIEAAIFAGVPVNVTLLFSREHYLRIAEAYLRGIERRIAAGLDPRVSSVASLFVSRWDRAVSDKVPEDLRNRLGIAIVGRAYRAHCELLASKRWRDLEAAGARKQRMLWASTAPKDPKAPAGLYVEALAAPDTIDTMPEKTLLAFAANGTLKSVMSKDGGDAEQVLARFASAGVDVDALAARLQSEGAESFVKSWRELMGRIAEKSSALATSWRQRSIRSQDTPRRPRRWWISRGSLPPITASGRILRSPRNKLRSVPPAIAAAPSTRVSTNFMCSRSVKPSANIAGSRTSTVRCSWGSTLMRSRHRRSRAPSQCWPPTASRS